MNYTQWLHFFKNHPHKKLFSLSDLQLLTQEHTASLSVQLTRLVRSGFLRRVARDWYENPFSPASAEEIAMILRIPSYLSMEYALFKQDVLSQQVCTLTVITTRLPYRYTRNDIIYEYHQIKPSLFWGFSQKNTVALAEPEKALLDLIYIRYAQTQELSCEAVHSLIDDMDCSLLNKQRLQKYCKKYTPRTQQFLHTINSFY